MNIIQALGADQVSGAKPKPDGLLKCCEVLKIKPEHSVYIGDSPSDGQVDRYKCVVLYNKSDI